MARGGSNAPGSAPARQRSVADIFMEALDVPEVDREAFVRRACPDAGIRAEVEMLLRMLPQAVAYFEAVWRADRSESADPP